MRIAHVFDRLNAFGGAEEHMTTLAELQKQQGDDVCVCLIQSSTPDNQYARRLRSAGVTVWQWPLWLNRLSGDWDTVETFMRQGIRVLSPLTASAALLFSFSSGRSRHEWRESLEGRLRSVARSFLNSDRQKQMFRLLLTYRNRRHKPDVLHLHCYGAGLESVLLWARKRNLATIHQEHSTPDKTVRRRYELPTTGNLATIVVTVSDSSARALRRLCGISRPIEVIAPIVAVAPKVKNPTGGSPSVKSVLSIVTVARLSEEKGLTYLIQAASRVIAEASEVRFLIYGDGPLRGTLEAQIRSLGLTDAVCLPGRFGREQLPSILGAADVFVLPSITEGFPVTVIEAMHFGLPIVATRVGGIPELVRDGVSAILCAPGNPEELAEALLALIGDPSMRRELGAAARTVFHSSEFTPARVVNRFNEVYARAIRLQQAGTEYAGDEFSIHPEEVEK